MAFDAGIMRAVSRRIEKECLEGRVEKIYQPERDEIVFLIRVGGGERRLLINAGSACPRLTLTSQKTENPATPPMFCLMLRKHFSGARLIEVSQPGFERVVRLVFECRDELGFKTRRQLICELMGKYSNIIAADGDERILGILKPIDFAASTVRQLLPGMKYTLPPAQDKLDPLTVDRAQFNAVAREADITKSAVKFLTTSFLGFAAVTAREIVYRASGNCSASLAECADTLFDCMKQVVGDADVGGVEVSMAKSADGMPIDFLYTRLTQYESSADVTVIGFDTVEQLIDEFYSVRASEERLRRKAADIFRLLNAAETRLTKKIALQSDELEKCAEGETYKKYGDLITGSIYMMKRGMKSISLSDWYDDGKIIEIPLSERMTPAQNAQSYYKKYNKSKSAKVHLAEQLEVARSELEYIKTVFDALSRAQTERELSEIRAELYHSGYASKMKSYTEKKRREVLIMRFETSDGHTVLCGKNNIANDHLTTRLANRNDWWFHVKGQPGSHVVLECAQGESEPPELAFTEAAMIAAHYSSAAGGASVPVDYTRVREVKKPAGAKPGYVIYHTNWKAFVTPDADAVRAMLR